MKKVKKRKSKNIATDKPNSSACYRFGVNPLVKHELLQFVKKNNESTDIPIWNNFEELKEFKNGVKVLAYVMGIETSSLF